MSEPTHSPTAVESSGPSPVAVAAAVVGLWTVSEVAFRWGLASVLAGPFGTATGAEALAVLFADGVAVAGAAWLARRGGLGPAEWGYDRSPRAVGAGLLGVVAYVVAFGGASVVLVEVFGASPTGTGRLGGATTPAWALALLLVVNGVVVPLAEELAWRGVVQGALTRASGARLAVAATAVAFVGKHLLVDGAVLPFRLVSLTALAVVLGVVRARAGTTASTVTHLVVNGAATAALVLS